MAKSGLMRSIRLDTFDGDDHVFFVSRILSQRHQWLIFG
jgi:hypothetical protein